MKKIKIAHVLHCVGGVDVYLRLILTNIDPERYEIIVLHGDQDVTKPLVDRNQSPVKDYKLSIDRNIHPIRDIKAIFQTYKILKKEQPDLIHCHSAKGGIIGRVVGGMMGIKSLHTPNAYSYLCTDSKPKRAMYLWIERFFANGNSILLASSQSEKNNGIQQVGYRKENTILFSNSINPITKIQPLSIPKTWPDEYICTVGRPSFQKNIELMIRVLHRVNRTRNVHLVLMGVGHYSDKLQSVLQLIEELKMQDKVTLLEWTDRENIFSIISDSKFYISTARYEGLPYSVIESLAMGKACVVSASDGNVDLIRDGHNGFVISGNDEQTFADRILELLGDSELLDRFSKNAYQEYLAHYDMTRNIEKLENIYSQTAERNRIRN